MRTGTIKCNQYFYDNDYQTLSILLGIGDERIEKQGTTLLIRCESEQFDIADDYPEYIFSLKNVDGQLTVKSIENTGRIV